MAQLGLSTELQTFSKLIIDLSWQLRVRIWTRGGYHLHRAVLQLGKPGANLHAGPQIRTGFLLRQRQAMALEIHLKFFIITGYIGPEERCSQH